MYTQSSELRMTNLRLLSPWSMLFSDPSQQVSLSLSLFAVLGYTRYTLYTTNQYNNDAVCI